LVVVVVTVVVFGGTTAKMLEVLETRTGVADEEGGESDDEEGLEPIHTGRLLDQFVSGDARSRLVGWSRLEGI
jgi:hypothetical protein